MSVAVMTWVFRFSQSTGNDRLVLLAIADRANDDGTAAHPSIPELAAKARCSESTARRAVQNLAAIGELTVNRSTGRWRNDYTVVMQTPLPIGLPAPPEAEEHAANPVKMEPCQIERVQSEPVHGRQGNPVTGERTVHPVHPSPPPRARDDHDPAPVIGATKPRRAAPGALAGSLPRDHIDHGWCGERFCIPAKTLLRYARRHSADVEQGRAAVEAWLMRLHDALGPDDSPGGNLWLDDLFETWLVDLGKVKPVAAPARSSRRRDEPATARVPDADATKALLAELRGGHA